MHEYNLVQAINGFLFFNFFLIISVVWMLNELDYTKDIWWKI